MNVLKFCVEKRCVDTLGLGYVFELTYITDIFYVSRFRLLRIVLRARSSSIYLIGNLEPKYKIELGADIADKVRARLLERLIKADYVKPVHFLG